MFINDVNKREEIRNIAIKHLRKYGIKYRDKSPRQFVQAGKCKRFFNTPLQNLENETVTLKNGQQLLIPKQLCDLCSFIITKVKTEGLFRKEGSKSRQNEIKLLLDRGCLLEDDHHEIDVAVVLKCFLRQLPEPLIPYSYHELFLRCSLIEKKVEAILLACLLLPSEHLNVLSFLMQFWNEVASQSNFNKMNSYNIAILVGPNIFPISEKIAPKNKLMVTRACDIIKLMIENSKNIGLIPDYIIEQIGSLPTTEVDVVDKIKRRRSGSLTRIFNGLKKIVGNRGDEEILSKTVTPDLLLTPANDLKKINQEHKLHRRHRVKDDKTVNRRGSVKTGLERRWSAITQVTSFKRRKTNSLIDLPNNEASKIARDDKSSSKTEYVQVSKVEYEEIKNRVSAIEKRLSIEFENVQSTIIRDNTNIKLNNIIQNIQSAYEQTLVQAEPLNSSTDQLAKRLGKELRIRNSEQKMIRSPSARKIGNMRRRSRELEKPNNKNIENQTLQFVKMKPSSSELIRRVSSPAQYNIQKVNNNIKKKSIEGKVKRIVSFQGRYKSTHISCNSSMAVCVDSSNQPTKTSAIDILSDLKLHNDKVIKSKIENQNVEIFQKNGISFDNKHDDVSFQNAISAENLTTNCIFSNKFEHKIGSIRKSENKIPQKIKTLKAKENRIKQNISTINKGTNLKQKERNNEKLFMEMKRLGRSNKENGLVLQENIFYTPTKETHLIEKYTPKIVPHIKKPIIIKSPKRLCRTPQNSYRNTPLKVLSTSKYYSPNV